MCNFAPMDSSSKQYDRMMTVPVERLIPSLAVPTVLSMMTSALYNTADTWFVSHLGDAATAAVGVSFPLVAVIQALGFWIGMGAASNISRFLGRKSVFKANIVAMSAWVLSLWFGVVAMVLGNVFNKEVVSFMGATETILPYAQEYSRIIFWGAPLSCAMFVFNNLLRSQGRAFFAMIGIISGSVINLGLDPFFIFTLNLGISGAAISTLLSQAISLSVMFIALRKEGSLIRLKFKYISKIFGVYLLILSTGLPSLLRQGCSALATVLLNRAGAFYGDAAVAAMSIVGKISFLAGSAVVGFGQGFQPVVGFAYGAGNYARVKKSYFFSLGVMTSIFVINGLLCGMFPERIMRLFNVESQEVVEIGAFTLQWFSFSMPFQTLVILANMLLQVTGQKLLASMTSLMRQGIVYIPYIIIMPHFFGLRAVQTVQPVSDIVSGIFCAMVTWHFFRKKLAISSPQSAAGRRAAGL